MMKTLVEIWRVLTVIALIFCMIFTALLIPALVDAHREGWQNNDNAMMNTFAEEASYLTYADMYKTYQICFVVLLYFIVTSVTALFYQHSVLKTGQIIPGGKWLLPILTALLHVGVVIVFTG